MTVLIIDDSKTARTVLSAIIRKMGFSVVEACDGEEGLNCLKRVQGIELALVDWNMPVMDGYDFVCAVRAMPRFRALRMMMVTTEVDLAHMAKAMAAGANEYVMKPFSAECIVEKLALLGFTGSPADPSAVRLS